jgi:hypothetical protein
MSSGVGKYRLGPFLFASDLLLPELTPLESTAVANASIRYGAVPERIQDVVANETQWWASHAEYLQRVPGVANFLAQNGRDILVEPAPGASPEDVRAYLLSPIFGALCHQAGMFALHASSVRVGDGVAAFLGHSGCGKSTLAACLERRGYSVVSDDSCLLDPVSSPGTVLVVPVAPALKLWRSAAEQLGISPEGLPRVFSRDDKYRVKVAEIDDRLPLREIFFLEWMRPDAPTGFTEVTGVRAIAKLMEFTIFHHLMKPTSRQAESFALAGRVLSQARAFTFTRPRDFAQIDSVVDAVEEHFAAAKR